MSAHSDCCVENRMISASTPILLLTLGISPLIYLHILYSITLHLCHEWKNADRNERGKCHVVGFGLSGKGLDWWHAPSRSKVRILFRANNFYGPSDWGDFPLNYSKCTSRKLLTKGLNCVISQDFVLRHPVPIKKKNGKTTKVINWFNNYAN